MIFTDVSSSRAVKVFQKAGFWKSKNFGKKHTGMTNGIRKIVIPRHNKLNPYTLKGIIRDAGLTMKSLKNCYNFGVKNKTRDLKIGLRSFLILTFNLIKF